MILRPALSKDLQALRKIFSPWCDESPEIAHVLESVFAGGGADQAASRVLEAERTIRCASLWTRKSKDEVCLWAVGLGPAATELGADVKFLQEEILEWAEMGISKVTISVPQPLTASVFGCLKGCGFIFEGISSGCALDCNPQIRLSKYFLYRSISHLEVMDFLRGFLASLGYEVREEGEGFGYRVKAEYRLPFIFSAWHRITRSGPDIVVHPPARVLELYELENLFFPLRIEARDEKPLFLPMQKRRANTLIDLPELDAHQNSLFGTDPMTMHRHVFLNNLTYCYPVGLKRMRKGLPLLFYVNGVGIVGSARIEDWHLDEPKNLYNNIDEMGYFDPEDVKECAAASGQLSGRVLVIRFNWYRRFKRPVTLEQIRRLDGAFNPQRTRSLSMRLFKSIVTGGNELDS